MAYSAKRDKNEMILYRHKPVYCLDHKNKMLRFCCFEGRCDGQILFDLKLEKFEEISKHTFPKESHELDRDPKIYEIATYFAQNPWINEILILREFIPNAQIQNNI